MSVLVLLSTISFSPVVDAKSASSQGGNGQKAPITIQNRMDTQSKVKGTPPNPDYFYNWSGYVATSSLSFTGVEASYTQPVIKCTTPDAWTVFWVGFDGYSNNTVEQAGTLVECGTNVNTPPSYFAWWEMFPTNAINVMPITIHPHDKIGESVVYSNGNYAMNVTDTTDKQKYTENATCASGLTCERNSADWIVERPGNGNNYTPLADWNNINISNAEASTVSKYYPISWYTNDPIVMINISDSTLAKITTLNTKGNSFSDSWVAAQ